MKKLNCSNQKELIIWLLFLLMKTSHIKRAEEYVKNFLFEKFHPHTVIIGYDHRFGRNRKGDYHLLENYGKQLGFIVKEIPEHLMHREYCKLYKNS